MVARNEKRRYCVVVSDQTAPFRVKYLAHDVPLPAEQRPSRVRPHAKPVQYCQPIISCLGSDGSSSGVKLLPRGPETTEGGHKELGFDGHFAAVTFGWGSEELDFVGQFYSF